jgi:hypothetical protein
MKDEPEAVLGELSQQVKEFLGTAKQQAEIKMQKKVTRRLEEYRTTIASERDKALKSLEAYLASDPLPLVENVVEVKLSDGLYEASSRTECEGGLKFEFSLSPQTSHAFHEPLSLSRLGHELKVPVRFSRAVLSKTRVPGFERLDQYVLTMAETSGGRIRANFEKTGSGAKIKLVTSGNKEDGFAGLEYSDQTRAVNVTNDPALAAFVDLGAVKKAAGELATEVEDLSKKKVALVRISVDGEQVLDQMDCRRILQKVMEVMGPTYRSQVKTIAAGGRVGSPRDELTLELVRGRLRLLGSDLSKSMSEALGLPVQ